MANRLLLVFMFVYISQASGVLAQSQTHNVPHMSQPVQALSPLIFDRTDLTRGAKVYRPLFDHRIGIGDIVQYNVSPDGDITTSVDWSNTTPENPIPTNRTPTYAGGNWSAQAKLREYDPATYWQKRKIIFLDERGKQAAFQWSNLSQAQREGFYGYESVFNYVRGDRSNEAPNGEGYRARKGLLGDILHSNVALMDYAPRERNMSPGDSVTSCVGCASSSLPPRRKSPVVIVGANDGMVHVLNASTGEILWSYVPSMIMHNMGRLTENPFKHTYLVDGHLSATEVRSGGQWRKLVVGGLGAGGKGFFALDLASPTLSRETSSERKILWEISGKQDPDIGYTHSQVSVARFENGKFYAVAGNGYESQNKKSALLIIDPLTGQIVKRISSEGEGLSSPTIVDSDNNGRADVIYAGDISGNLYRYKAKGKPEKWRVYNGVSAKPLFKADQPIIQAPSVARHPAHGLLISFATGRYLTESDVDDNTQQAIYGIWDTQEGEVRDRDLLVQKVHRPIEHDNGAKVRTLSGKLRNDRFRAGWRLDLPEAFRLVSKPIVTRAYRLKMTLTDIDERENWAAEINFVNGGGFEVPIFDLNGDGYFDDSDRVDGNLDGDLNDVDDIPMLWSIPGNYSSGPSIARLPNGRDLLVRNTMYLDPLPKPPECENCDPEPPECENCGPGLAGGHFDFDTDNKWGGSTDAHEHEYDDKTDRTYADFFDTDAPGSTKLFSLGEYGISGNQELIVLLANADLSPGAIIQIGKHTWNAVEYQRMIHQALLNWDGKSVLRSPEDVPLVVTPNGLKANGGTLRIAFDEMAIVEGGLHPTQTGCVKSNASLSHLTNGRWRNGALIMQLIDRAAFSQLVYRLDPTDPEGKRKIPEYEHKGMLPVYQQQPGDLESVIAFKDSTQDIQVTLKEGLDHYGGLIVNDDHAQHMLYEGTLFWHFNGSCYGEANWAADKASAGKWILTGFDDKKNEGTSKGKKNKKDKGTIKGKKNKKDKGTSKGKKNKKDKGKKSKGKDEHAGFDKGSPSEVTPAVTSPLPLAPNILPPHKDIVPGPKFLPGRKAWADSITN